MLSSLLPQTTRAQQGYHLSKKMQNRRQRYWRKSSWKHVIDAELRYQDYKWKSVNSCRKLLKTVGSSKLLCGFGKNEHSWKCGAGMRSCWGFLSLDLLLQLFCTAAKSHRRGPHFPNSVWQSFFSAIPIWWIIQSLNHHTQPNRRFSQSSYYVLISLSTCSQCSGL